MWLQLHYTNYITPQLQLHYATTTTTVAVHDTTSSSCGWGDHCNHCNHSSKHNSNHLSVNQWIRSAIRDSQQRTPPIGFLFWNFRHRLMRYYWDDMILYYHLPAPKKNTLLRVIPTLAFQVIYSDICFDILPNILSDIYYDILSGISSSILSGIYFGVLSGIYSGILCGILSRIYFGILCGILCGIYSGSLSDIYSGSLSGIYSGIPSGRWGPAVPTELGRSQVEVQRCPLGSEGP